MSNALELFRAGFDYLQIASHLNTTEAEVERQIHELRKQEREAARIKEKNIRLRAQLADIRRAHG